MKTLNEITGPFVSEQQFKQAMIRQWKDRNIADDILEIENEEKEPGMPDVLAVIGAEYGLAEFKLSDENGVITFQRTQPLFYKRHPKLSVRILAWDAPRKRVVFIPPKKILAAKSLRYKITEEDI